MLDLTMLDFVCKNIESVFTGNRTQEKEVPEFFSQENSQCIARTKLIRANFRVHQAMCNQRQIIIFSLY